MYHATTAAIGVRLSVRRFWEEIRRFEATVFDFMGSTPALLWKRELLPNDRDNPARLGWGVPFPDFAPAFEERFGCRLIDCYGVDRRRPPGVRRAGRAEAARRLRQGVEGCEVAILSPEGRRLPPRPPWGSPCGSPGAPGRRDLGGPQIAGLLLSPLRTTLDRTPQRWTSTATGFSSRTAWASCACMTSTACSPT